MWAVPSGHESRAAKAGGAARRRILVQLVRPRGEIVDLSSPSEYKRRWDTAGWCVIENVIPPDVLDAAQRALPEVFPTADEFADGVDPDRNASFLTESGAPRPQFPFERAELNRVALHDVILDLAERLLTVEDMRLYQAAVTAKYSDAAPDYEQLLHVDYANHTLVVPRTDVGYQHVTMFVYLSDVTPETGATRVVSRAHTAAIPVERTYLHIEEYAHLYALEEPASGPAGSVLVYRPDVFHRGVPLTTPRAARFLLPVAFKPPATDWIGFHAFPGRAEDLAWHRFVRHATVRQLTVLGFPKPGDAYWTTETLAGVAARYPSLDMNPWRDAG
jgi:ectoine hydroxylase-related dioxygenase (phytanoyl-CoA dioxygenase family)